MTPEIKHRIGQIRRGEMPYGYNRVRGSIIPSDWKQYCLGELGKNKNGLNFHREDKGIKIRILGVGDFGNLSVLRDVNALSEISMRFMPDDELLLKNGDIVFVRSNGSKELVGRNLLVYPQNEKVSFSGFCIRFRLSSDKITTAEYINLVLDNGVLKQKLQSENQGSNISNLNQSIIDNLQISIPCKGEQQKIVAILTTQDRVIELKENRLAEKQRQKKYLMQQLLTGKKRLPGFSGEWKKVKIGSFIKEIDERSTVNNQYEILSVTKNGMVFQSSHFNKQIASENNVGYKVVRRGNLAFSTMNLWMGSLDTLRICDIGIVSPAYKVFEFNQSLIVVNFAENYMKSAEMIWLYKANSEQGASIVRRNLDLQALLNSEVALPDISEQNAIAEVLSAADREIGLLRQDIEQEKQKKKALMQLLLTGIVRVKS